MQLEINNLTSCRISSGFFKKTMEKILKILKLSSQTHISLAIVNDQEIKKINKLYRGQNKVTDVISVPVEKRIKLEDKNYWGEIILNYSQVKKQAEDNNHSIQKELTILIVHSILHLIGHDHQTDEEAKKMSTKEEMILKKL
ncbi:MAG: rRNA maturation RNase YbeY [Patescibacteria group bacterium]|nr:rRNA maturation RNase YbeY [Patescibacteria group bacterium]